MARVASIRLLVPAGALVSLALVAGACSGSQGEPDTSLEVDLTAAVEHLRAEGVDTVVVMGASMGNGHRQRRINARPRRNREPVGPVRVPRASGLAVAANVEEPTMFIAAADPAGYS